MPYIYIYGSPPHQDPHFPLSNHQFTSNNITNEAPKQQTQQKPNNWKCMHTYNKQTKPKKT